jgi:hypothetical protein
VVTVCLRKWMLSSTCVSVCSSAVFCSDSMLSDGIPSTISCCTSPCAHLLSPAAVLRVRAIPGVHVLLVAPRAASPCVVQALPQAAPRVQGQHRLCCGVCYYHGAGVCVCVRTLGFRAFDVAFSPYTFMIVVSRKIILVCDGDRAGRACVPRYRNVQ